MGLFSRKQKPDPKLIVDGIGITFQREYDWWQFDYRGVEFFSVEAELKLPSKTQLDAILHTVDSLRGEMRSRLQKGLSEWGDSKLDDGESCIINIQNFIADATFVVTWSDGKSWGDLGVDFTIKDGAILDESWGD